MADTAELYRRHDQKSGPVDGLRVDGKTVLFEKPVDYDNDYNRRALDVLTKSRMPDDRLTLDEHFKQIRDGLEQAEAQAILKIMDDERTPQKSRTVVIGDELALEQKRGREEPLEKNVLLSLPHLTAKEVRDLGGRSADNKERGGVDVVMQKREETLAAVKKLLESGRADSIEIGKVSDKKLVEELMKLAEEKNVPLRITDPALQKEFGKTVERPTPEREPAVKREEPEKDIKRGQPMVHGSNLTGEISYVAPDYDEQNKLRAFKIGVSVNGAVREATIKPKEQLSEKEIANFIKAHEGKTRNVAVDKSGQAQIRNVVERGQEIVGELKRWNGNQAIVHDDTTKREYAVDMPFEKGVNPGSRVKIGRTDGGTIELREVNGKSMQKDKDRGPER